MLWDSAKSCRCSYEALDRGRYPELALDSEQACHHVRSSQGAGKMELAPWSRNGAPAAPGSVRFPIVPDAFTLQTNNGSRPGVKHDDAEGHFGEGDGTARVNGRARIKSL